LGDAGFDKSEIDSLVESGAVSSVTG